MPPRRVLIVHNAYQQRGGEDGVVEAETALLQRAGIEVETHLRTNDLITSLPDKIRAALSVTHNRESIDLLRKQVDQFRPDLVHVHNTFPLVSPGALDMVAGLGVPLVATLHNFRMICAGGMLLRNGQICERCVGGTRMPAVLHRCYRSSVPGSMSVARMGAVFRDIVDHHRHLITLIALTDFAKSRFVRDGFDARQIVVRPNWTPDPGDPGSAERERTILFVGRLSPEKGADLLVTAASRTDARIEIVGSGPELDRLRAGTVPSNVAFMGPMPREAVLDRMKRVAAVAVPSRWYEGFPMVVVEAMACGTAIVASDLGSLGEVVEHGRTGLLFPPGDPAALADRLATLLDTPNLARILGRGARAAYEARYSEGAGLRTLLDVYEAAQQRGLDFGHALTKAAGPSGSVLR